MGVPFSLWRLPWEFYSTRRLERPKADEYTHVIDPRCIIIPLALSGIFAFLVAWSDFVLAAAVRQNALQTHERYGRGPQTLWFKGHWGFQFTTWRNWVTMRWMRNRAIGGIGDFKAASRSTIQTWNIRILPDEELAADGPWFLTDLNRNLGASFYSSLFGPLPFAFGDVTPERVLIWRLHH